MKDKVGVVLIILLPIILWGLAIFGEVRCIYKMCMCNWEPVGKAEILYTVGTFSGAGVVIGYFDIEDK